MDKVQLESKFVALWRKALKLETLDELNVEIVEKWAKQFGLKVQSVREREVGIFQTMTAIVIEVDGGAACLPKIPHEGDPKWVANRDRCEKVAALWSKMEWFAPLWVSNRATNKLLKDVEHRPKKESLDLFEYHTSTIYTLAYQAVCIVQLIPSSRSLAEFAPLVREAYLAFYSGHRASSIAALMPVMEGALRRISSSTEKMRILDQIDTVIDGAIALAIKLYFEGMWAPREYRTTVHLFGQDERVYAFETYRRWLKDSFFRRTGEYDGMTWLNRHLFAHGASIDWQNSANFTRLVVALATLGVIESWHDESHQVSVIFPDMNDDSRLLHQQAIFRGQMQMAVKLKEQESYQKHGRLVPTMPTDDGVTLRAAVLMQDCINDLVRPLRDAGWSVAVGKHDGKALYVQVVATKEDTTLRVALLFSCGTANSIYRELAETNSAILYRGAPYEQEQYAYGINVHVGPVTGWQPPLAPGARRKPPGGMWKLVRRLFGRT